MACSQRQPRWPRRQRRPGAVHSSPSRSIGERWDNRGAHNPSTFYVHPVCRAVRSGTDDHQCLLAGKASAVSLAWITFTMGGGLRIVLRPRRNRKNLPQSWGRVCAVACQRLSSDRQRYQTVGRTGPLGGWSFDPCPGRKLRNVTE
jgi:hypothetical protein